MPSSPYDPIVGFGVTLATLALMAGMVRRMTPTGLGPVGAHHSIPWEAKRPLIDRYGRWAVNLAEARCPEDDVECVEREARILFETTEYRRR